MPIDALSVLCAQLTRDLLAIAKFLFVFELTPVNRNLLLVLMCHWSCHICVVLQGNL